MNHYIFSEPTKSVTVEQAIQMAVEGYVSNELDYEKLMNRYHVMSAIMQRVSDTYAGQDLFEGFEELEVLRLMRS